MMQVTFLGTSAAIPTSTRSLPAILIKHEGHRYLVDCGEGTQLRLMQAGESLKIPHIFLTHDHLDHILGLGGLLFSLSLRRMEPVPSVSIYGGNAALKRARTLATMIRSNEKSQSHIELNYVEITPGIAFEDDRLAVTAFLTNHRKRHCFGYVFQSKGKSGVKVVFTGDTGYMDSLIEVAGGADCLVSEANFALDKEAVAIKVGHLTAVQAASIAAKAKVKCLMLNHVSREYANDVGTILTEAQTVFPNTLLPSDLDRFQVDQHGVHHLA
jgi:ribonuclease Z